MKSIEKLLGKHIRKREKKWRKRIKNKRVKELLGKRKEGKTKIVKN